MTIDPTKFKTKNPREAAYYSLLAFLRDEAFIFNSLEKWQSLMKPTAKDARLAREIAYGTARMALALDHIAKSLTNKEKLSLKTREKIIVRMAIYQYQYMDKIPIYAINNESIELAKKTCHESFVKFLNAILRRLPEQEIKLPKGRTVPELSIHYSYPQFFVQELIQNHGLDHAIEIMESENKPSPTMFRIRPGAKISIEAEDDLELLAGTNRPVGVIKNPDRLPDIAQSKDFYIQNVTPAVLIDKLAQEAQSPRGILDLCSSPGGKIIAAHDYFPKAELFANDISPAKLKTLSDNFAKHEISATLSSSLGEEYRSEQKFDLIILDVPCSNSGVLHKRPEARWRIDNTKLEHLEELQMQLIKHASTLLEDEGEIWYMTCSVLKRENERLIERACKKCNLEVRLQETILPNNHGWDGGFGCALRKKS